MSHAEQLTWVTNLKTQFPDFFVNKRVLEVGSLNINGSIRQFFTDCDYTGIDIGPGQDVDVVCSGHEFDAPSFDVAASCECFEHNPFWAQTFLNMWRLLKPDGLLFMSCATTGRPEHGTSRTTVKDSPLTVQKNWEYYRNLTIPDFEKAFPLSLLFSRYAFSSHTRHCDLYFWGVRRVPII